MEPGYLGKVLKLLSSHPLQPDDRKGPTRPIAISWFVTCPIPIGYGAEAADFLPAPFLLATNLALLLCNIIWSTFSFQIQF